MSEKPVVPFESFGVASWVLLNACMSALPELRAKRPDILDRVLLMLERLQLDPTGDEELADIYAGARRLIEGEYLIATKDE
ncbi:MAG: hypothetical protein WBX25_07560 [Rhodomicrobium sp.]